MRLSSILVLFSLAACGDSNGPQLQPASFAVIAGAAQVDTVGRELKEMVALRVVATDGISEVPNYPINWTPLDGGQVFATVVYSGTDGIARQRWTLGTGAGTQRLVARALDPETGDVMVDDTVTAEGVAESANRFRLYVIDIGPGGAQTIPQGDSVRIGLSYDDRFGNTPATCPDGGSPYRIAWWSEDSTVVVPSGVIDSVPNGSTWRPFTWLRGIGIGTAEIGGTAECLPANNAPHMGWGVVAP